MKLGEDRFIGTDSDFLSKYSSNDRIGKLARQGDAKRLIEEMKKVDQEVEIRETNNANAADKIERMNAEHRLNMDYLFSFGIRSEHRTELLRILMEVEQHGGMTINEATALANARSRHGEIMQPDPTYNVNGLSGADPL